MTNNIYPPDHLLRKWESLIIDEEQNVDVVLYEAFQAGADQELEACCEWVKGHWLDADLRAIRRPKPPSLKEQALQALAHLENGAHCSMDTTESAHYIRRALESLPD
jgi:hypothetical protein